MVQSPERSGKPNLLQEELASYLLVEPPRLEEVLRQLRNQPVPGKAWKVLRLVKPRKPTITKVKGENWQYWGSKVEIHLELS